MRVQGLGNREQGSTPSMISVTNNKSNAVNAEDKKLKQACKDFESIFLGYLLKSMRKTVSKSELMGSSQEEDLFQGMMDDEICKSAAENNSIGIADALHNQLNSEIIKQNQNGQRGDNL